MSHAALTRWMMMKKACSDDSVDLKFRAFSDRTRLRILHLLRDAEICVGDLEAILEIPQPTVSRHLGYLRRAKLVQVRKSGQWSYYSLMPAEGEFHQNLLNFLEGCFSEVPEIKADRRRADDVRRTKSCCPE